MKLLLSVAAIALASTPAAMAADYYIDMDISPSSGGILPIQLTHLMLDVTSTGRFYSANGAFYSEVLDRFFVTFGTCMVDEHSEASCNLQLNIFSSSLLSVDIEFDPLDPVGGVVFSTPIDPEDLQPPEIGVVTGAEITSPK